MADLDCQNRMAMMISLPRLPSSATVFPLLGSPGPCIDPTGSPPPPDPWARSSLSLTVTDSPSWSSTVTAVGCAFVAGSLRLRCRFDVLSMAVGRPFVGGRRAGAGADMMQAGVRVCHGRLGCALRHSTAETAVAHLGRARAPRPKGKAATGESLSATTS